MPVITLTTHISAPIERVFDLSRSIDVHQKTTEQTSEKAIGGVTSGLIKLGEEVTWEATHFGIRQRLSSKITQYERPTYFQDVMLKGAFSMMKHDHRFCEKDGTTVLEDVFEFKAPFGLLGKAAEIIFLTRYMKRFLEKRNLALKELAESHEWKKFLNE